MYSATVEIYSDESNTAVVRHPGRKFPGVLVQGDTLHALTCQAADALAALESADPNAIEELEDLKARLEHLLQHYQGVMAAHGLELPYVR